MLKINPNPKLNVVQGTRFDLVVTHNCKQDLSLSSCCLLKSGYLVICLWCHDTLSCACLWGLLSMKYIPSVWSKPQVSRQFYNLTNLQIVELSCTYVAFNVN
jgi:hypothetical protein